jgi:hypothetical protein
MAGDEVVMPENAFMMIYDPSGLVMGTSGDMHAMAEALDKIAGSLVRGYAAKSGRPEEEIVALMAAETWFDAKDALDLGLATRIAEPVRMAAHFDVARFRNAPPALVEAAEADAEADDPSQPVEQTADPADPADPAETEPESLAAVESSDATSVGADPGPPPNAQSTVAVSNGAIDATIIRAEAIAHARAVIDLCRLAGLPQMAGRFLEPEQDLDQVRNALLAAKAEAEPEIAAHHPQPGRSTSARPWGEIVARTFKLKG